MDVAAHAPNFRPAKSHIAMSIERNAIVCAVVLWAAIALPWIRSAQAYDRFLASPFLHRVGDGLVLSSNDPDGSTYTLQLQTDCNLCATKSTDGSVPYWCWTFSASAILKPCGGLFFTTDGNLNMVYQDASVAWTTGSAQAGQEQPWIFRLVPSGAFGIYSLLDSSAVWSRKYQGPGANVG